jgi:hypothetical protein
MAFIGREMGFNSYELSEGHGRSNSKRPRIHCNTRANVISFLGVIERLGGNLIVKSGSSREDSRRQ